MPTATLEDYLAQMQPFLPKQQAPVQMPQVPQINPLELMVAQELMSALQPRRSVTPRVPKNSAWITPQMVQGAAQTNVAEQRLRQDDQALAQSRMNAIMQNQAVQQRIAIDQARQLQKPTAAEQAQLKLASDFFVNEMMTTRQETLQEAMLNRQIEAERQKRELPLTEQQQADLAQTKAHTAYYGALTEKAGAGEGGAGVLTPNQVAYQVAMGLWTPEEGRRYQAEHGMAAPPATMGEQMLGWFAPKPAKERKLEAETTIKEQEAKEAVAPKKTGLEGFSDKEVQSAYMATQNLNFVRPTREGPQKDAVDAIAAEYRKRFLKGVPGAATGVVTRDKNGKLILQR